MEPDLEKRTALYISPLYCRDEALLRPTDANVLYPQQVEEQLARAALHAPYTVEHGLHGVRRVRQKTFLFGIPDGMMKIEHVAEPPRDVARPASWPFEGVTWYGADISIQPATAALPPAMHSFFTQAGYLAVDPETLVTKQALLAVLRATKRTPRAAAQIARVLQLEEASHAIFKEQ